jgi:hypothetical protein
MKTHLNLKESIDWKREEKKEDGSFFFYCFSTGRDGERGNEEKKTIPK